MAQHAGADEARHPHEVVALRDEIVVALGTGGAIDQQLLLSLFPWMRAWPVDTPIDLLTEGKLSGKRFGPLLRYTSDDEPVYVKLSTTGRYSVACSLDIAPDQWRDRGAADEPDSLIDAVLAGLELRDAAKLAALMQRPASGMTDVQWMRHRLAHELADSHPPLMRALGDVAASRSPEGTSAEAAETALRRVLSMTPDEILEAAGLRGVRDHDSVFYASLRASIVPGERAAKTRSPHTTGPTGEKKPVDAPMLLEILKEYWAGHPRSPLQLADDFGTDPKRVTDLVSSCFIPTSRGLDLLWKKDRGMTCPLTPGMLQAVVDRQANLPTPHHLFAVSRLCKLSYENFYKHIRPSGLTEAGRQLLEPDSRSNMQVSSLPRGMATGDQELQVAISPRPRPRQLTADDLLQLIKEFMTPGEKDFDQLALRMGVRVQDLESRMYRSGAPKASGLDLIHTARRTFPLETMDPDILRMTEQIWKTGWMPTPYHLLVVAREFNVSFDKLQRRFSLERGLTGPGERFMSLGWTRRRLVRRRDLRIPWERLADPSKPLRLTIDAGLLLEVEVKANVKIIRVINTGAPATTSMQSTVLPAPNSTAIQARVPSPDLADVLENLPGSPDAMLLSPDDQTQLDASGMPTPALELPDDLASLREEDLVHFPAHPMPALPKRPRLAM